ncbi:MAG: thioredoxin domain-containing protein [Myxococcota bacterium]
MSKKQKGGKTPKASTLRADEQDTTPLDRKALEEESGKHDSGGPTGPTEPEDGPAPLYATVALVAIVLLSIFGIGAGIYMTMHHEMSLYGEGFGEIAGCAESEGISCDVVNTSDWSELFGVPQFTWAIPTYVTMGGLALWAAFKQRSMSWVVLGIAVWCAIYSVFLAYISKVELGFWCLWCMRLYAANAAILLASIVASVKSPRPQVPAMGGAAGLFVLSVLIAVGGQKAYRSTLLKGAPELENLPAVAHETTKKDPEGPAPVLSWQVTTEDGNPATLQTAADDPWKGNKDSKVAVVEFADFECGYCKRASGELRRLYEAYGDRVLFVYKHFPMDPACNPGVNNRKHRNACLAAQAGVCAQKQGVFWAFHDLTFKNQHQLGADDLTSYLESAGGDKDAFLACMRAREGEAKVVADATQGMNLQTHGTPRIWVNGTLYRAGQSAEQMAKALEVALGASAAEANQNAASLRQESTGIAPIPADVAPMRKIALGDGTSFEIDTFESAVDNGTAKVGKHEIPGTRMSWFAANDACQAAGKRMCTEKEWIAACQGAPPVDDDADGEFADDLIEGTTYPYGDYHEPGRCWENRNRDTDRPVYTGEMPGCISKDGVYDLTGNVEEWAGASAEEAVLLGGAYDTSDDHARCYRRNTTFGAGYASLRTGFRCCR